MSIISTVHVIELNYTASLLTQVARRNAMMKKSSNRIKVNDNLALIHSLLLWVCVWITA